MRLRQRVAWFGAVAAIACGGGGTKHEPTLDERIQNVNAVGTRVDGRIYAAGEAELLVLPLAADGSALLDPAFSATVQVLSPAGLEARVVAKTCEPEPARKQLAAGIAVDASSSMRTTNDPPDATGPAPMRRAVVGAIVGAMQAGDVALLTDFSSEQLPREAPLRDLVCAWSDPGAPETACAAQASGFTSDRAALLAARSQITDLSGSPIYEACVQMVPLVATQTGARRTIVLLSDGLPTDPSARATCLSAAQGANVAIFTVGFGAAAEGREDPCSTSAGCPVGWSCAAGTCRYRREAVLAMRELAQATSGTYAPATAPELLFAVAERLAYAPGSCALGVQLTGVQQLQPGTPIELEVAVGANGARARFQVLAPPR